MATEDRERDITLSPNEYAHVLDKTKGTIRTCCGSLTLNLSANDALVVLDEKTKRFREASVSEAVKTFITAPEGWYVQLKNPEKNNGHPVCSTSNQAPELHIGKKINIPGPCSFALFPGQMAKVIEGHRLCNNQYLVTRVYENIDKHKIGDVAIIKGIETSFYIPPTGIEVVPLPSGEYVRNAVTLKSLGYCILLNEEGEEKYIHGPAVVFPEPDEVFMTNKQDNSYKFKAIEVSDISGIYVKVIADYYDEPVIDHYVDVEDEEGNVTTEAVYKEPVLHKAGEELFITGKDQAIYYPRPEHMIITYGDCKQVHHAIAIPAGEGRYVLNRLTGEIRTVVGPTMFLPDPRYEVIVRRKLTKKQCELWYPGNDNVLEYNGYFKNETIIPKGVLDNYLYAFEPSNSYTAYLSCNQGTGNIESTTKMDIERSNTYTPPRTITIDNKYDGVVTINVWSGYAVSVVNKFGKKRVIVGPQTVLLDYDEELEIVDNNVYLRIYGDAIPTKATVVTNDLAQFEMDLRISIGFNLGKKELWFNDSNYKQDICNGFKVLLMNEFKNISSQDVLDKYVNLVAESVNNWNKASAATVIDVQVLDFNCKDGNINQKIHDYRRDSFEKMLRLNTLRINSDLEDESVKIEHKRLETSNKEENFRNELEHKTKLDQAQKREELRKLNEITEKARLEAEKEQETLRSANEKIRLQREKDEWTQKINLQKEQNKVNTDYLNAEIEAKKKILDSISPNLVEAITTASQHETLREVTENISPYLLAGQGESVADMINKLVRGTSLEGVIDKALTIKNLTN